VKQQNLKAALLLVYNFKLSDQLVNKED